MKIFNFLKRQKRSNIKYYVIGGLIVTFSLLFIQGKSDKNKIEVNINGQTILAETASTPKQRYQGLMHRNNLKPNEGMLFYFDFEGNHSFWMKNTFIPLDIIWIDEGKNIVHIEHSAPPCDTEPCITYRSAKPAKYVLELKGGWAVNNNIQEGDKIEF